MGILEGHAQFYLYNTDYRATENLGIWNAIRTYR